VKLLEGERIRLRALEPEDLAFLEQVENNPDFWLISHTLAPFSRYTLGRYIQEAGKDIFEARQQRFAMSMQNELIGFIDLFDFDPVHRRAGIGIVIPSEEHQGKGFAKEGLELLCTYGFRHLGLHQLYANILEENSKSIALFENLGFKAVGLKKDWVFYQGEFRNELLYQKLSTS
jgi:diamine N-acetyltransferase